jgi:hypothetical protein
MKSRASRASALTIICVVLLAWSVVPLFSVEEALEGNWVRFALTGRAYAPAEWGASSVLESDRYWEISRYDPGKALDADPDTAWVEGAPGPGIGETLVLAFSSYPEALGFINGYAKNQSLFDRNHRVKALNVRLFTAVNIDGYATETVTFYDALPVGPSRKIQLADALDAQRVRLPISPASAGAAMESFRASDAVAGRSFPQAAEMGLLGEKGIPVHFRYVFRLEIAEVYRGTTWEDTCLAEIWPDYGEIVDVAVDENMRRLLLTTADGRRVGGYADFEYVLTVVAQSDDAEWVIVIKEPAYPGSHRVTSEYAVIHTPTGRDMTDAIFADSGTGSPGAIPFDFDTEDGTTFVLYDDPADGAVRRLPCVPVYGIDEATSGW